MEGGKATRSWRAFHSPSAYTREEEEEKRGISEEKETRREEHQKRRGGRKQKRKKGEEDGNERERVRDLLDVDEGLIGRHDYVNEINADPQGRDEDMRGQRSAYSIHRHPSHRQR